MQKVLYYLSIYKKKISLVVSSLLFILLISLFILINNKYNAQTIESSTLDSNKTIKVDVKGSVNNPGVVELNDSSRVVDAINKCGGFTEDAYQRNINLAKKLKDENVVIVYSNEEVEYFKLKTIPVVCENEEALKTNGVCELYNIALIDDISSNNVNATSNTCVNINKASIDEITTLEGIGKSKAEKIIEYRNNHPFNSVSDLLNVDGIGEKMYETIKDSICV